MSPEHATDQRDLEIRGRLPNTYPNLIHVKELLGYQDDLPHWGERMAVYHPLTSQLTALSEHAWNIIDNPQQISAQHTQIQDKLESRHILIENGKELTAHIDTNTASNFIPEVYIHTTEACNLSCSGCAVGANKKQKFDKPILHLDHPTLQMGIEKLTKAFIEQGSATIKLKWGGGEPMMPKPFKLIQDGQSMVNELRETHPDLNIEQVIITNGTYLTAENLQPLVGKNIHVAVSLWGLEDDNDLERGVVRPADNFQSIMNGVKLLHKLDIPYNINHVITPTNADKFADFLTAMWDVDSPQYLGKEFTWETNPQPLPIGIGFFRPQTIQEIASLKNGGYTKMLTGLRKGFSLIRELIVEGKKIPKLGKFDYLQLFDGVIAAPCGTGLNYVTLSPRGITPCHETLFNMSSNLKELQETEDPLTLANLEFNNQQHLLLGENITFPETMPESTKLTLAYSGGSGCPRTSKDENNDELGHASSIAQELYAPILEELLALETMRRIVAHNT